MKKNKKGFTLIELLAVIVIIGVLMVAAIPAVSSQLEKSRKKAFYASVYNIVSDLKADNLLDNKENCLYNYAYDEEVQTPNIGNLKIWVHKDTSGKVIYSVLANRISSDDEDGEDDIDIYDFSKTTTDFSTWIGEGSNSASEPLGASLQAAFLNIFGANNDGLNSLENFSECRNTYITDSDDGEVD